MTQLDMFQVVALIYCLLALNAILIILASYTAIIMYKTSKTPAYPMILIAVIIIMQGVIWSMLLQ